MEFEQSERLTRAGAGPDGAGKLPIENAKEWERHYIEGVKRYGHQYSE